MADIEKKTGDIGIEPARKDIAQGNVTEIVRLSSALFKHILTDMSSSMARVRVFPTRSFRGMSII